MNVAFVAYGVPQITVEQAQEGVPCGLVIRTPVYGGGGCEVFVGIYGLAYTAVAEQLERAAADLRRHPGVLLPVGETAAAPQAGPVCAAPAAD